MLYGKVPRLANKLPKKESIPQEHLPPLDAPEDLSIADAVDTIVETINEATERIIYAIKGE